MSLASGLLLSLAFPPAELWPLAFVAVAPLLWLLRSARPRRGALLGFVYGVGFYGATLYWILRFGELAWVGLVTLSALSVAVVGLVGPAVIRAGRPLRTAVGLAALWTLVDWIRGMWPLGGFTWGSLGISQVDDRVLLPLAGLAGVWGVTFVVAAVNALLVETAVGGGGGRRRAALPVLAAALIVAPVLVPFSEPNGGSLDVAAVQVDVRVPPGTDGLDEDRIVAERNVEVHRSLAGAPRPDLVLWGEGALDPGASSDPATVQAVRSAIAEVGAPAAIGAVVDDPDGREFTSALIFDGRGRLIDRYDKVHLVPFGEYVPWRSKLDWISATEQIPVDRTPGSSVHTVAAPGVPPFGTPICFENSFPRPAARLRPRRRDVPRRAGQQRVVRVHGGLGPAPADEPDARGRDRPLDRRRRRLGGLGLRRHPRPRRGADGAVPDDYPAGPAPDLHRDHVVRADGGLAAVALSWCSWWLSCSRLVAAPRSGPRRRLCRPPCARSPSCRRTRSARRSNA